MECRRSLFNKYACITVHLTRATETEKNLHTERDDAFALSSILLLVAVLQAHVPFNFYTRTSAFFATNPLITSEKFWNCKKEIPNSWQIDSRLIEVKSAQECRGSQWRLGCSSQWAPGRDYWLGGRGNLVSFALHSSFRDRSSLFKVQRCMKENWWGTRGRFLSAMRMVRYRIWAWGNDTWRGPRKASAISSVTR